MSPEPSRPAAAPRPDRRRTRRPVVSVCIANWNCRDHLRACLATLTSRRQGVRLEVIVVDNASTDGAADLVAAEFPRVRLVRNAVNVGFSRANNQAAARARGRFLLFLNNDTEVPPGTLGRLVAFARAHPEASVVGPRLVEADGAVQTSWRARPTVAALLHRTILFRWTNLFRAAYREYRGRSEERQGDKETRRQGDEDARSPCLPVSLSPCLDFRPVEVLMGAALLLRRRLFRRLGGWDEGYTFGGEDIDLCARAAEHGPILYHPATTITHHGRVSSRQAIGYAHGHTVVGITRYLRKAGASPWLLLLYKVAVTLDAPLTWASHVSQYAWRRLKGEPERAERSRLVAEAAAAFLTRHLVGFWRA